MARVRSERMNHYRRQQTYTAIECENARAAMAKGERCIAIPPAKPAADTRTVEEIARAAAAALKGAI